MHVCAGDVPHVCIHMQICGFQMHMHKAIHILRVSCGTGTGTHFAGIANIYQKHGFLWYRHSTHSAGIANIYQKKVVVLAAHVAEPGRRDDKHCGTFIGCALA